MPPEDELEQTMMFEEEMVRAPREIRTILEDFHRARSEAEADKFRNELFNRLRGGEFQLDDDLALELCEEILETVKKWR